MNIWSYIQQGLNAQEQIGHNDLFQIPYTTKVWSCLYKGLLDSCLRVLDKILVKFYFSDFVILQTQNV